MVNVMSLVVLVLCLALSWSPWYVAGTLGYEPEIVVSYPAARCVAYWAAALLLAVACAAAFVASRDGARRRAAWRGLSLAASAGACSSVVLGLFVEPGLTTRLWGTSFAPVALVTADLRPSWRAVSTRSSCRPATASGPCSRRRPPAW